MTTLRLLKKTGFTRWPGHLHPLLSDWPMYRDRIRGLLLGTRSRYGLLFTLLVYALLTAIGFVYLYPLLFML
ncbi:MAG: hypothetical protein N3B68_10150, partial [Anaerolineae bacterium]|nr:hypothetical protein [Anaerolineae bacterium]